ncbi:hypothetical protein MUK42_01787 [Musa troglodytarum]|uniref:Uncharacterized protein n=1 Tax=Musa troglodytarum TaxID=320322 RepID=A0A9E7EKB5_9LILI|nr:hypothetical protein MUK42_01787 [Musa troglodytarum]
MVARDVVMRLDESTLASILSSCAAVAAISEGIDAHGCGVKMQHRVAHSNFGGEFCLLGDSAMRSKCRSIKGGKTTRGALICHFHLNAGTAMLQVSKLLILILFVVQ